MCILLLCVQYTCAIYVHINSGLHSNTLLLQLVTPKLLQLVELCVQLAEVMKHLAAWSASASSTLTCSCELASKPHVIMLMCSINVCMLCSSENIMIFVYMGCGFPILSFRLLPFCSPPVLMLSLKPTV